MVTRKDINETMVSGQADILLREIMTKDIIVCYPDENLKTALQKLAIKGIGRVPVVERSNPLYLIGLITRENIIDAYNEALKKRGGTEL
jgi:CIC family chloride channel protein